jgi:hypothetical protein
MVGEHPTQTSLPGDDLKPAWRVACVAYRKVRQAGELAARAAIQKLRPDLDEHVAGQQASAAIHYASVFHTKWLSRLLPNQLDAENGDERSSAGIVELPPRF